MEQTAEQQLFIRPCCLLSQPLSPAKAEMKGTLMVVAPYYENSMVGGNEFGSPLPQVHE